LLKCNELSLTTGIHLKESNGPKPVYIPNIQQDKNYSR
jgi:hypothetical protein